MSCSKKGAAIVAVFFSKAELERAASLEIPKIPSNKADCAGKALSNGILRAENSGK